jgi:MFS family permease
MMATLFASQSLFSASTIMSFTLMPIISARLGESDGAAGVPPTVMMLGRAISAYPAGWMMDRLGRRPGLSLGYALTCAGAALCVASVSLWTSFLWFSAGVLLMGMGRGVLEQSRFVAAEIHSVDQRARAIGLIVLAGTVGAIGGPLLVEPSGVLSSSLALHPQSGPFLLASVFTALALLLTQLMLRPDPLHIGAQISERLPSETEEGAGRRLTDIFANGDARFGVAAMVVGQFVMTLLMVITPLHMNHHAHGTASISWVIMAHTLGMYGLSSLTGRLSGRIGAVRVVWLGAVILAVSAILTPASNEVPLLGFALFLLGLGWNFCFIAGSTILSDALASNERGRAQGAGETVIAFAAGAGSLGTGLVFAQAGILAVCVLGLAVSVGLLGGTTWWRRRLDRLPEPAAD